MESFTATGSQTESKSPGASTLSSKLRSISAALLFRRRRTESAPIEDLYGEYKTESQLYFTDKLYESRHWSLWHTIIFIIVTWNTFIIGLQLQPLVVNYLPDNIRCEIPALEKTNWTFSEIKSISQYGNGAKCYYYDLNYNLLSHYTYKQALIMARSWNHTEIKKCYKCLLPASHARYDNLDKFELLCDSQYHKLFHFVTVGEIIGFVTSGFIADIYGRRKAMILAVPISVVGCILKTFAPTYWSMYIFTCVTAASLHTSTYIGIILLLEIVHCNVRSFMVIFIWVGFSIAAFLKMALFLYFRNWTANKLQWVIMGTLLVPLCTEWLLPESPHWLLCNKRWKEMLNILHEMNYPKLLPINEQRYQNSQPLPLMSIKQIVNVLLKPRFRRKMLLGGFLFSLTYFLYFAENTRIMIIVNSEPTYSLIEGICIIINMVLVPLMLKNISRPMSICTSLLILAFFYCATSMYLPYSRVGTIISYICLVLTQNATIINGLLIVEMFPTRVRSTAIGICRTTGSIMVVIGTVIKEFTGAEDVMGTYGWTINGAVMLIAAFLCVFLSDTGNLPLPDTELQAIVQY